MLGDLNIAEPGALIGFAGPRVIEQTIRQKLPEGFQRSEFLLKHGMLDAVVPRPEMKTVHRHGACASSWLTRAVNYPDSVQFLYSLGNEIKTAKLGLERIGALLEALGNPQDAAAFVHVAGTNGKGSTCAMIESGLRAAGLPHGTVHLAAPARAHGAHPHRRRAGHRSGIRRGLRPGPRGGRTVARRGADRPASDLLRNRDGDGVPDLRAEARWISWCWKSGLGGRLDATNVVTPRTLRDHADRFRSRGLAGQEPGGDRRRKRPAS